MVEENPQITDEHVNAYNFTIENQVLIKNLILKAVFEEYPQLKKSYDYDVEEAKEIMPDIYSINDLEKLINLSRIHILNVNYDGLAYVGYEFTCSWDEEHGLGILTHKERVVEVGGADTSILTWKAENDLEQYL